MKAVILAGGKGTRLKEITGEDLPKVMVPIAGKPLLQLQIEQLVGQGLHEIVLLTGYQSDRIRDFFGSGERLGARLEYVEEKTPLGTAGAVRAAMDRLGDEFLLVYGDLLFSVDFQRLIRFHREKKAMATLLVHPNDHPRDSDLMALDDQDGVLRFFPKKNRAHEDYANIVNAAICCLDKNIIRYIPTDGSSDFGADVFPGALQAGEHIMAYRTSEYVKDIGTPDRLEKAVGHLKTGLVVSRNLGRVQKAVFFDRDGTLNRSCGFIRSPDQIELETGVAGALRRVNSSAYLSICVTNQPVIARGECDEQTLSRIHNRLEMMLGDEQAYLERIFYCPHHPDSGFPGERKDLKIPCNCRKPAPGLLEQAAKCFNLDLGQCYMVGDRTADIELARRAGLKSVLLRTGDAGRDGMYPAVPDRVVDHLPQAVEWILSGDKK